MTFPVTSSYAAIKLMFEEECLMIWKIFIIYFFSKISRLQNVTHVILTFYTTQNNTYTQNARRLPHKVNSDFLASLYFLY